MKFTFRLETVLKERGRLLVLAQQAYFEAQSKVDAHLAKIKSIYDNIDSSRKKIGEFQRNADRQGQNLNLFEGMIQGQRERIKILRNEVRELMRVAEEKREIMVARSKDVKVMEKLKEKRKEEFIKAKKISEAKKIDEVVSQRFKRGAL